MNLIEQQDYYAERLGRYLSNSAGYRIHFGGKITSSLWEGKIRLRDVTLQNITPPGPGEALIDLRVEELAVRISLEHWIRGGGLLTALEAQGVTGKIDGNAGGKVALATTSTKSANEAKDKLKENEKEKEKEKSGAKEDAEDNNNNPEKPSPTARGNFHLLHVEIRDADLSVYVCPLVRLCVNMHLWFSPCPTGFLMGLCNHST